jgi:hypothetical protein
VDDSSPSNVYLGLAGFGISGDCYDLGEGITLRKIKHHLGVNYGLRTWPAKPEWRFVGGGYEFDITAELRIPTRVSEKYTSLMAVANTIVFLIDLNIDPAVTLLLSSTHAFDDIPNAKTGPERPRLLPIQMSPKYFPMTAEDRGTFDEENAAFIREHWPITLRLIAESPEFANAVEASRTHQFVANQALAMVMLWAALEAFFSPSTTELKFRVSALIAAFLKPYGEERRVLQKRIAKLYDRRSSAAHGKPDHEADDVIQTSALLTRVLRAIVARRAVPKRDELEALLFGD